MIVSSLGWRPRPKSPGPTVRCAADEVEVDLGCAVAFRLGGGSWKAGGMTRVLPPPSERFDPITARWVTPGGPLHDPQRDSFDPDHREPVELVGPIPRELAGLDGPGISDGHSGAGRWRRRRWVILTIVGLAIAAMLIGGFLTG